MFTIIFSDAGILISISHVPSPNESTKNNCYQSLLKAGELKDLVDKGAFGTDPAKNNFGWFALNRAYPDRFVEVMGGGDAQPS